jgi:hypothetical protein
MAQVAALALALRWRRSQGLHVARHRRGPGGLRGHPTQEAAADGRQGQGQAHNGSASHGTFKNTPRFWRKNLETLSPAIQLM